MVETPLAQRLRWLKDVYFGRKANRLAKVLGVSNGYLSDLLSGEKDNLSREKAENFKAEFERTLKGISLDIDWLMEGTGHPPPDLLAQMQLNSSPMFAKLNDTKDYRTPRAALGPIVTEQLEMHELHARLKDLAAFCDRTGTETLSEELTNYRMCALGNICRICTELMKRGSFRDVEGLSKLESNES